ncbi:MAG: alpha-amylase family glycosyl hydrolase [Fimbriimonas sp.]
MTLSKRLDAIKKLGVNVIWLMPIYPVGKVRSAGGLGSPYAVADFEDVNPEFGTPADFQHLVAEAHRRKIAVILDWVPNHTAWDNPWVRAHPEWYTRDAQGNIQIPAGTNWQDVADLNYDNREMRKAMIAAMKGWIDRYGIDGFRIDAADFVPHDFWKEAVPTLRQSTSRPLFMLAEGFRTDHYTAGFDLTFGWNFYHRLKEIYGGAKATILTTAEVSEKVNIPPKARRLRFTSNHDFAAWEGTTLDFFKSPEGVKTAITVTTFYGGTPLIYMGQEVAWPERIPIFENSSIDWTRDPQTEKWMASLFDLRRKHPALRVGTVEDTSSDDAVIFRRKHGANEVLVVANVRNRDTSVSLAEALRGRWRNIWTGRPTILPSSLSLPAYGCQVFVR